MPADEPRRNPQVRLLRNGDGTSRRLALLHFGSIELAQAFVEGSYDDLRIDGVGGLRLEYVAHTDDAHAECSNVTVSDF